MRLRIFFILGLICTLFTQAQGPDYKVFSEHQEHGPDIYAIEFSGETNASWESRVKELKDLTSNRLWIPPIWVFFDAAGDSGAQLEPVLRTISRDLGPEMEGISLKLPLEMFESREGLFQVKRLLTAAKSESPKTLVALHLPADFDFSRLASLQSYADAYWLHGFSGTPEKEELRGAFDRLQKIDPGSGVYLADSGDTLWSVLRPWGAFFKGAYSENSAMAGEATDIIKEVGEGYIPAYRGLDVTPSGDEFLHLTIEEGEGSDLFLLQVQRAGEWVNSILPADPVQSVTVEPGNPAVELNQGDGLVRFSFQAKKPPLALIRTVRKPDPEGQAPTSLMAKGEHVPPVEWIMARVQARSRAQRDHLKRYIANARVTYQYELPGFNTAIDVDYDVRVFMTQGEAVDWELLDLYLNGVRWTRGGVPELPMFEPGQVVSMPLDLELDASYDYEYLGRRSVDGRACYLVGFNPKIEDQSLYRGRVWVDTEVMTPVQIQVVQTNIAPPLQSSEQEMLFRPVSSSGFDFWLPVSTKGQELIKFGGNNIVAQRKVSFGEISINPEDFSQTLETAQSGENPFVRKTQSGLKYLERLEDGTLQPKDDSFGLGGKKKLWLFGTYWDSGMDYPVPLAGFNYTDLGGAEGQRQVNLFIGGAINYGSVSWPHLFGNRDWHGYLNLNTRLFPGTDKVFVNGIEDESLKIKDMSNSISGGFGRRVGEFIKVNLEFRLAYVWYDDHEDTDPLFVVPESTLETGATLSVEGSRWGYSFKVAYGWHKPLNDDPWGLNGLEPGREDFRQLQVTAGKIWRLRAFQQMGLTTTWAKSWDADRFSRYSFGLTGPMGLSGFKGSGIRFTEGRIARLSYQFNLANIIRFGVSLDHARVRPWDHEPWDSHTGIGFSGTFLGPKRTLINLDVGYALQSEFDPVEGDAVVSLIVVKMF